MVEKKVKMKSQEMIDKWLGQVIEFYEGYRLMGDDKDEAKKRVFEVYDDSAEWLYELEEDNDVDL